MPLLVVCRTIITQEDSLLTGEAETFESPIGLCAAD
jgi:hypothetical protein